MDTTPLLHSPSNFSISISPHLISGFKNQTLWSSQANSWRLQNDEAAAEENNSDSGDGCLAVVPWVPSQLPSADVPSHFDNYEMMDAEEEEETTKDVEESRDVQQRNDNEARGNDGVHQWQQQEHCMIPQFPHNTATPVFWYR